MHLANLLKCAIVSVLILALAGCAPTAKREGAGEYVDDALITTKVKAALAADPDVKAPK